MRGPVVFTGSIREGVTFQVEPFWPSSLLQNMIFIGNSKAFLQYTLLQERSEIELFLDKIRSKQQARGPVVFTGSIREGVTYSAVRALDCHQAQTLDCHQEQT